jgi:hypothetical protein
MAPCGYAYALARLGEVVDQLAGLGVGGDGSDRDQDVNILAVAAMTVAAFSVRAAAGAEFRVESELEEGIELIGGFHEDRPAAAAIAPGGPAARDEFFSSERCHPIATVAAFYNYSGPVQELHC